MLKTVLNFSTGHKKGMNRIFKYASSVRTALANHEPVVALESTILTHGYVFSFLLQILRLIWTKHQ